MMPKYRVEYGFDVPAYGSIEMEAANKTELISNVFRDYRDGRLIDLWEIAPDCGCKDYRIVGIVQELANGNWERIDDGFCLDDEDGFKQLWVVYDDDSDSVMGFSADYDEAVEMAARFDNVRILASRL